MSIAVGLRQKSLFRLLVNQGSIWVPPLLSLLVLAGSISLPQYKQDWPYWFSLLFFVLIFSGTVSTVWSMLNARWQRALKQFLVHLFAIIIVQFGLIRAGNAATEQATVLVNGFIKGEIKSNVAFQREEYRALHSQIAQQRLTVMLVHASPPHRFYSYQVRLENKPQYEVSLRYIKNIPHVWVYKNQVPK